DPLAGLKELARQVKAAGVERVTGDVMIDDRLFDKERSSGSGPGLVTPIVVNDNVIDVQITPASTPGWPALVTAQPETVFAQVDGQVDTRESGDPFIEVSGSGPGRIIVRGRIGVNAKPAVRISPVGDPAAFARALFIECLRREGVAVEASP